MPRKPSKAPPGVYRHFCATYGSPLGFEADHYLGGMNVYAASLDTPEGFEPSFHVNYQSKLPWLALTDDLPKFNGTMLGTPTEIWSDRSQTNDP